MSFETSVSGIKAAATDLGVVATTLQTVQPLALNQLKLSLETSTRQASLAPSPMKEDKALRCNLSGPTLVKAASISPATNLILPLTGMGFSS